MSRPQLGSLSALAWDDPKERGEPAIQNVAAHARTDAFHHWVLAEAPEDLTTEDMDAKWAELGDRFEPRVVADVATFVGAQLEALS